MIWSTLYISVAALAAGTYRELADQLHYAGYIFVAVIALFIVLVFVGKKVLEKVEHRHLHGEDGNDEHEVGPDVQPTRHLRDDVKD